MMVTAPEQRRRRWPLLLLVVIVVAGAGAGGWYLYDQNSQSSASGLATTPSPSFLDGDGGTDAQTGSSTGQAATPLPSTLARHPEVTFGIGFPQGWDVGWDSFPIFGAEAKVLQGYPDGAASGVSGFDDFPAGSMTVLFLSGAPLTLPQMLEGFGQPGACTGTGSTLTPFETGTFSGQFAEYTGCGTAGTGVFRRILVPTGGDTNIYLAIRGASVAAVQDLQDTALLTATDSAPATLAPPRYIACVLVPVSTDPANPTAVGLSNETSAAVSYEVIVNGQVDQATGAVVIDAAGITSQAVKVPVTMRFTYANGATAEYTVTEAPSPCVRVTDAGLVQG